MPSLPRRKVGLISCSGEELPEGTLARMATLRVLEQLRPNDTVTLCLPLFLAGDDQERAFARFYPTIAIDGCDKRCAARGTETYSGRPAASLVIPQVLAARGLAAPRSRRQSDAADESAVEALAQQIARRVDEILGVHRAPQVIQPESITTNDGTTAATCSCGSGIPVTRLTIAGENVEIVALPTIFDAARKEGQPPEQMFETVKLYNAIPAALERVYREAIFRAYAEFLARGSSQEV